MNAIQSCSKHLIVGSARQHHQGAGFNAQNSGGFGLFPQDIVFGTGIKNDAFRLQGQYVWNPRFLILRIEVQGDGVNIFPWCHFCIHLHIPNSAISTTNSYHWYSRLSEPEYGHVAVSHGIMTGSQNQSFVFYCAFHSECAIFAKKSSSYEAMHLNICTEHQSPRLRYILDLLLTELNGISWRLISSKAEANTGDAVLVYSADASASSFPCIYAEGLLNESSLRTQKDCFQEGILFPAPEGFSMNFDVFAAAFYLVSRYEEYLPFQPDAHDRFPASESILHQAGLLHKALINHWAIELKNILLRHFPKLEVFPRRFEYISTLDIDQAWKYRNKGFSRNLGGFFRDFKQGDWDLLKERIAIQFRLKEDPYDNFNWQRSLHAEYPLTRVQYFILLGDHGNFDKNCDYRHPAFRNLLQQLHKEKGPLGIHPSYQSNQQAWRVKEEVNRLKNLTGETPHISRQHFLMHRMPQTFQTLIEAGITEDHTLGYSTHAGFRAGIAAPFYFFDLHRNAATELRLFPFCLMDITHLHYEKRNAKESIRAQTALMDEVAAVGGLFCSLWHNESLSENGRWKGRRQVYEALFREGSKLMI